jgi:WD40 repeat protein
VIASGSQDCSVHFWRLSSGNDSEMRGYPFKPKALAWDAQSKLLATSGDATVTVWDFGGRGPEGSTPVQLTGHKTVCTTLAFSPRKCVLASGSQDGSVLVWEPRREATAFRYGFLDDEITGLAWAPDHRALLASDAAGGVVCWETGA